MPHYPADVLVGSIPHFDAEGQVAWNVVQVGIGELPQQFVHRKYASELAPQRLLPRFAQLLEHAQRMQLTVTGS